MAQAQTGVGRSRLAAVLLVVAAVFYVAGFVHLRADFPNYSVWSDWSKMTDEGWYGSAAIQHFVMGRWFLPGSFNPAVAMPVWPVMLGGVFSVTGVSMIAARALTVVLYGLSLLLLYAVVRRDASSRVAALAVLLTAVNPFCYAFDRLAVLEPVTVFWMMLGLWLAGKTGPRDFGRQVLLGLVLCLLILTKPTGVALVPAVLYLMWAGGEGLVGVASGCRGGGAVVGVLHDRGEAALSGGL
jgi:4-amino-4-deoxy-L-arabinose transferase-like glycosyltransferase